MLTKKDIDYLKDILVNELREVFVTKNEFTEFKDEFDELKTDFNDFKDRSLTSLDEIVGEIKSFREEMTLIPDRLADHTDRIEKLEQIHQSNVSA